MTLNTMNHLADHYCALCILIIFPYCFVFGFYISKNECKTELCPCLSNINLSATNKDFFRQLYLLLLVLVLVSYIFFFSSLLLLLLLLVLVSYIGIVLSILVSQCLVSPMPPLQMNQILRKLNTFIVMIRPKDVHQRRSGLVRGR